MHTQPINKPTDKHKGLNSPDKFAQVSHSSFGGHGGHGGHHGGGGRGWGGYGGYYGYPYDPYFGREYLLTLPTSTEALTDEEKKELKELLKKKKKKKGFFGVDGDSGHVVGKPIPNDLPNTVTKKPTLNENRGTMYLVSAGIGALVGYLGAKGIKKNVVAGVIIGAVVGVGFNYMLEPKK